MIRKCGNCNNIYTWDCPRPEAVLDDTDICASYSDGFEDKCFDCKWFFECNGSCGEK